MRRNASHVGRVMVISLPRLLAKLAASVLLEVEEILTPNFDESVTIFGAEQWLDFVNSRLKYVRKFKCLPVCNSDTEHYSQRLRSRQSKIQVKE